MKSKPPPAMSLPQSSLPPHHDKLQQEFIRIPGN